MMRELTKQRCDRVTEVVQDADGCWYERIQWGAVRSKGGTGENGRSSVVDELVPIEKRRSEESGRWGTRCVSGEVIAPGEKVRDRRQLRSVSG
jgi:hypothetical protein